ncbi:MAG TPA: RsmG family class I SAM-dependent methyltransferase [Acidimicrobiales bacterium]|nr:RsmG family class I SAM-dependent methyltransferase [Acidimicrobiales bacterium]
MTAAGGPPALEDVLEQARQLGFLGPGPVAAHVQHAGGFVQAVGTPGPARVVDLGSGGGVPGLVLAFAWPGSSFLLLESKDRRAAFLAEAVQALALSDAVRVAHGRAEEVGRDPAWRGWADLVVARSFGPPAVTAECASPLLHEGGRLVVSEPPVGDEDRWPAAGLAALGLRPAARIEQAFSRFQVLRQDEPCPEAYPRRSGVPAKRPLF